MSAQVCPAGGLPRRPLAIRSLTLLAVLLAVPVAAACGSTEAELKAPEVEKSGRTRPAPEEPVSFFRSQAPACRAHAKKTANPQVEAARFIRASLVDSLGGGSFLIRDGFGLRLVVRPADRVVLPESGRDTDEMPAPYAAGCPPEVFKGTTS